jgi:hypothetical protein
MSNNNNNNNIMNNEYFCSLIDKKDLNSIIPNYFCDEIGH